MIISNDLQVKHSHGKRKQALMSVVRSTSCSGGWLKLVVQGIFGFIIVCSFILISTLTIHSHIRNVPEQRQRCRVQNCRVICNDAPFFGEFESDILQATKDTESNCGSIILTLNDAMFVNSTLPKHWLSSIRVDVRELVIMGGNLRNIPPETFQSQFGGEIRVLVLEKITITTLAADTFIGLSNIQELYIEHCEIIDIRHNALQAIDNTLEALDIRANNFWNPINITGSSEFEQLRIVDFSMNDFSDILGHNSFSKLKHCTVLFLNSCNIVSIGAGAFDSLKSIEILHLNNNYLISLPYDIFNKIIPLEPRISLHDNLWNCSCYNNLRLVFQLGLLIVEPICFYPIAFRGEKISSFEKHCADDLSPTLINEDLYVFGGKSVTSINNQCTVNFSLINRTIELSSPLSDFRCVSNLINQPPFRYPNQTLIIDGFSPENNWLKPTFSINSNLFTMISLIFSGPNNYGLMWYHSKCPQEIYCINHLPKLLRVYNRDLNIEYTFCRISLTPLGIHRDKCVSYNFGSLQKSNISFYKSIILTVGIAIISLLSGALLVYGLIHKNPILLKGNKRFLFVKHKTVDALILPAEVSLKDNMAKDSNKSVGYRSDIFVISKNKTNQSEKLSRANSVRTNESNDHSYISALQPTEDQLAKWRITRNFEATYAYESGDSNLTIHSRVTSTNALPYRYENVPYGYDNNENIYDTIKA